MANSTRPTSISVISWLVIIGSALGFMMTLSMLINTARVEQMDAMAGLAVNHLFLRLWLGVVFTAINFICGLFMLKGRNWSRIVYMVLGGASIIVNLFSQPTSLLMLVIPIIFYLVIVFFLYRKIASRFFKGATDNVVEPSLEQGAS